MTDSSDPWDAIERASRADVTGVRSDTDDQLGPDHLREAAINPNAAGSKGQGSPTGMMPPMMGAMGGGQGGGQAAAPMMGGDPSAAGMAAGMAMRGAPTPGVPGGAAGPAGVGGVGGVGVGGIGGIGSGGGGGPFAAGAGSDAGIDLDGDGIPDVDRYGNPLSGLGSGSRPFNPSDPSTWPPGYQPDPTGSGGVRPYPGYDPYTGSGGRPGVTTPGYPSGPSIPGEPYPGYPGGPGGTSPTYPTYPGTSPSYPSYPGAPGSTSPTYPGGPDSPNYNPGGPGTSSYPSHPGGPGISAGNYSGGPTSSSPGVGGDDSYVADPEALQKATTEWDQIKQNMAGLEQQIGLQSNFGLVEPVKPVHNELSNDSATWGAGASSTFDDITGKLAKGKKNYSGAEAAAQSEAKKTGQ